MDGKKVEEKHINWIYQTKNMLGKWQVNLFFFFQSSY
jgi:hypothetical protein